MNGFVAIHLLFPVFCFLFDKVAIGDKLHLPMPRHSLDALEDLREIASTPHTALPLSPILLVLNQIRRRKGNHRHLPITAISNAAHSRCKKTTRNLHVDLREGLEQFLQPAHLLRHQKRAAKTTLHLIALPRENLIRTERNQRKQRLHLVHEPRLRLLVLVRQRLPRGLLEGLQVLVLDGGKHSINRHAAVVHGAQHVVRVTVRFRDDGGKMCHHESERGGYPQLVGLVDLGNQCGGKGIRNNQPPRPAAASDGGSSHCDCRRIWTRPCAPCEGCE